MASISRSQWPTVKELYESGLSMQEVATTLHVSLNAVTYVMRKIEVKRRTFAEANKIAFEAKVPSFTIRPTSTNTGKLIESIGVMLYWAEGYKTHRSSGVDFANSDPDMLLAFMLFLRSRYIYDKKRLRAALYCYADNDVPALIDYWSALLDIPKGQFTRPFVRADYRDGGRKMKYGVLHLRYSDKKMLR